MARFEPYKPMNPRAVGVVFRSYRCYALIEDTEIGDNGNFRFRRVHEQYELWGGGWGLKLFRYNGGLRKNIVANVTSDGGCLEEVSPSEIPEWVSKSREDVERERADWEQRMWDQSVRGKLCRLFRRGTTKLSSPKGAFS